MIFLGVSLIAGFGIYSWVRHGQPTAGLKVDTSPPSLVFVNNTQVGTTPVDQLLFPGEATVKVVPDSTSSAVSAYETKVTLTSKTYTVIRRDFGTTDADSAGETISLSPQPEVSPTLNVVTSSPDSASVMVDGQPQGFTPLSLTSIDPGTHQITVSAPGFSSRTMSVQTVASYKLSLTVKLAASSASVPLPVMPPSASPSAALFPAASPSPAPVSLLPRPYVTIIDTPTGFLRVRSAPSLAGKELGQVKPQTSYPLLDSKTPGWYLIQVQLDATSSGWISSQYATAYR